MRQAQSLGPAARERQDGGLCNHSFRFEPSSADLPGQFQNPLHIGVGGIGGEHERQHPHGIGGNDLRPLVTDAARQGHGLAAALKQLLETIEVEEAVADHAEVGDFDAPVAVRPAQLDASIEIPIGAGHPALGIGGIAKAPSARVSSSFDLTRLA